MMSPKGWGLIDEGPHKWASMERGGAKDKAKCMVGMLTSVHINTTIQSSHAPNTCKRMQYVFQLSKHTFSNKADTNGSLP